MEQIFDLNPLEQSEVRRLQGEHQELLARFGAATLELEGVRAQLQQSAERQRILINQAVQRHGITGHHSARIDGGHLICRLPDEGPGGLTQ